MSGRFVRNSKFRHVFGEGAKPEGSYTDVRALSAGDGNFIKINPKYVCCSKNGGGGPVYIHKRGNYGRFDLKHPVINVHKSQVLDFDFCPFDDDLIATASDDCTICITRIPPNGLTETITEPDIELLGHSKKVSLVHWHPTANNVLASTSYDRDVKVWNVETGEEMFNNIDHEENIFSIEWSDDGSKILSTSRDRMVRVFDPRVPDGPVQMVEGHEGSKTSRGFWVGDKGMVGSVGFSKTSQRKIMFWDCRKMDKLIHKTDLDQAASVMCPFYDPDVSMLYLAGKGDGTIRFFELTDQPGFCFFLADYRSNTPQKGSAWLPKRACDVNKAELALFYRLTNDTIHPVSMQCPRRNANQVFQEDIFPDCYAGKPAMDVVEYENGKDAESIRMSMRPVGGGSSGRQTMRRGRGAKKAASPASPRGSGDEAESAPAPVAEPAPKKKKASYKPPKKVDGVAVPKKATKQKAEAAQASGPHPAEAENAALKTEVASLKDQLEEMEETVMVQAKKIKSLTSQLAKMV